MFPTIYSWHSKIIFKESWRRAKQTIPDAGKDLLYDCTPLCPRAVLQKEEKKPAGYQTIKHGYLCLKLLKGKKDRKEEREEGKGGGRGSLPVQGGRLAASKAQPASSLNCQSKFSKGRFSERMTNSWFLPRWSGNKCKLEGRGWPRLMLAPIALIGSRAIDLEIWIW